MKGKFSCLESNVTNLKLSYPIKLYLQIKHNFTAWQILLQHFILFIVKIITADTVEDMRLIKDKNSKLYKHNNVV